MMNLRKLLLIQGILTFATFLVLVAVPTFIPGSFDIKIAADQYLLCYFLSAAELGAAYLSFASRKIVNSTMVGIICTFFIIFHGTIGILSLYGFLQGMSPKIIGNVIFRFVLVALFCYYGIYQTPNKRVGYYTFFKF